MTGHSAAIADLFGEAGVKDCRVQDGILNVNKPIGWTSHDVVAKLRGLLKGPKVGHGGTLDPAATGVLPVLVGQATRIAEYVLVWDKEYEAVLRLGETTDTQDATGVMLTTRSLDGITDARIRSVVAQFHGSLDQLPPMYSAIKVGGVPLYKAARSGKTVARDARQVMIHHIEVTGITGRDVSLRIVCSKGTYVRTLCADIGAALGVGGHLFKLVRRRVGPLSLARAFTIDALIEQCASERLGKMLLTLDEALSHLPELVITDRAASNVAHGVPVPWASVRWDRSARVNELNAGQPVRLKNSRGCLLAIGRSPIEPRESALIESMGSPSCSPIPIAKVLVHH